MRFDRLVALAVIFLLLPVSFGSNVFSGSNLIPPNKFPVFNVTIHVITVQGRDRTYYFPVLIHPFRLMSTEKVISLTYDNSTWVNITTVRIDNETGTITITGKTEGNAICRTGVATGRNLNFWGKKENCYSSVSLVVNGREVNKTYADANGSWFLSAQLAPGINHISVIAKDPGRNMAQKDITVSWSAPANRLIGFYLKDPHVIGSIGLVILLFLILLFRHIIHKKKAKREEDAIRRDLDRLMSEFFALLEKYASSGLDLNSLLSNPEIKAKAKQILSTKPFMQLIDRMATQLPSDENRSAWNKELATQIWRTFKKYSGRDFNTDLALALSSLFKNMALDIIREKNQSKSK